MNCQMCGEKEATIKSDRGNLILCEPCFNEWENDHKRIDEFVKAGHSQHCACRQVWGDGECECSMYKEGYNPYAWMGKKMEEVEPKFTGTEGTQKAPEKCHISGDQNDSTGRSGNNFWQEPE